MYPREAQCSSLYALWTKVQAMVNRLSSRAGYGTFFVVREIPTTPAQARRSAKEK